MIHFTPGELRKLGFRIDGNTAVKCEPQAERQTKTVKAFLTCTFRSEANANGKLRDSLRRKREQKEAVVATLGRDIVGRGQPKRVTFCMLTSQPIDGDNLQRALKAVRDQIAELCGMQSDAADIWEYQQRKPFEYEPRGCWVLLKWK